MQQVSLKRIWIGLHPGLPGGLSILDPVAEVEGYLNACGHFRIDILASTITEILLDRLVHEETLLLDIAPFLVTRFQPGPAAVAVTACQVCERQICGVGRTPDQRPFHTVPDGDAVTAGAVLMTSNYLQTTGLTRATVHP